MEQREEQLVVSANSPPHSQYCIFTIPSISLYISQRSHTSCVHTCVYAVYKEIKRSRGFPTFKPYGPASQQKVEHDAEHFCSGPTEQLLGVK